MQCAAGSGLLKRTLSSFAASFLIINGRLAAPSSFSTTAFNYPLDINPAQARCPKDVRLLSGSSVFEV